MKTILKKSLLLFTTIIIVLGVFLLSIPSLLYAIECTDYAYQMRDDLAKCRPLGAAKDWAKSAEAKGFPVDNMPQAGDIAVFQPGDHKSSGNGHVAYVERVNSNGTIYISEMNFPEGSTEKNYRTEPVLERDRFIHKKPDLVVTGIKFFKPGTTEEIDPRAGQKVTAYAVLENVGGYRTVPFNVKWFLDGIEVANGSNSSLEPNACYNENVYYDWQATEGTHTIKFEADCYCVVYESYESNNSFQKEFNVPKATLLDNILNGFQKIGDFFIDTYDNAKEFIINKFNPDTRADDSTVRLSSAEEQGVQSGEVTITEISIPAPSKPSLTSPYNWYQSLGSAPTLIWKGDENSISYYVIVNSSNTGDIKSGWIDLTSWKPNLPNENYIYSWKVKAKNSQGVESGWSEKRNFSVASTTLKFEGNISFSPPSPSSADQVKIFASTTGWGGVGVTLRVSVNTAPDGSSSGEWRILKELGVPKFNEEDAPVWNTKGWQNGTYRIRVEAKGPNDPNWRNPAVVETTYTLVNKAEEQAEAKSVQKEGFSSCIILDEEYCNKGELIYYPGDYGIGFIGLGFTLPEGTKIYSPFKGLAEENVGIIVFGGSGLYGFDILDASDPEWGWKHQRDYLFVGGGVRTIIEIKPMFTENPVEKGQVIAEVTKNQKIITPDGKEYDIAITFMHYDADNNIWSYNEELLNKYFHYR